jgi:hypothetical protein
MVNINPDKHIRKALFTMFNTIVPCYDMRVAANKKDVNYILLTNQGKNLLKVNKCEYRWDCNLLIEIYCRTPMQGNNGSRLVLNDIEEQVMQLIQTDFTIDNYNVLLKSYDFEANLETVTETDIITRSFIRLNLTLI